MVACLCAEYGHQRAKEHGCNAYAQIQNAGGSGEQAYFEKATVVLYDHDISPAVQRGEHATNANRNSNRPDLAA